MIRPDVHAAINAALRLLPKEMDTPKARVMLLAIGMQESRFRYRRQIVNGKAVGPAKGWWQFERLGGCRGVVDHSASRFWLSMVCESRDVNFNATAVWNALEVDDVLAAAAARLLLFTDPHRLPAADDARGAWNLYKRTWRPGKPHRGTWDEFHQEAFVEVMAWGTA